ncbi:hypothetical protein N7508_001540 [Penicillium antarcticum]|uniref:uncharacterized protein n=1 Tax=Penicillium antarcticum TaxID=416450 RepID=UPI0023A46FCD|nr:uncharacterized protein N7508_001540 [Penicillium antarcticum]KAJ5317032.1 hypothetical protein N7508_001540 [Penicillium antarcticum]
MLTVGHLSFCQWKNPANRSATKRRDLLYWTNLAKILDKGDFNALSLADTFVPYDTYKGTAEPTIRNRAEYLMGDPAIHIAIRNAQAIPAMASVTKNLGYAITTSTSYAAPYVVETDFPLWISGPVVAPVEHCDLVERIRC